MEPRKILEIRKLHRLTQAEFAKRLKVSRHTVMNWENGATSPSDAEWFGIVKIFNISFHEAQSAETGSDLKDKIISLQDQLLKCKEENERLRVLFASQITDKTQHVETESQLK